ncbi:type II toxin-antitoxin system ParD family antitoxin [Enterovirga aerilata]|uniref:Type II toxin-antitoxin system ParD family antitoxin n=1 Tax=Enterovirga aerilata TaxID=2730920 RepID=A0A849IBQ3_9HYPH|nr:type II toxin-antitoxin system ParD family antitoxin [Enterovirga sp. DB1703]NNM74711.1 type II toxin-antitoxin system ParD family antitoxin [Enterovirga sp. DB1703]
MPTMNIDLTAELAEFVEHEVRSGRYTSASELVHESLILLEREREYEAERELALREAVQAGIDQAERGIFSDRTVSDIAAEVLREKQA